LTKADSHLIQETRLAPSLEINLRALDGLRGFLALYVLAGHARWLLWAGHREWLAASPALWELPLGYSSALLRYGREAVMIFFVLSGFFIHLKAAGSLSRGVSADLSPGAFYGRRLHRLLPPYLFALMVTIICDLAGRTLFPSLYHAASGDVLLDKTFSNAGYTRDSVLSALFLLPSSVGVHFGSNGPLWSIAYEVVYYALYPAWFALRRWSALAAYAAVPLACLATSFTSLPGFPQIVMLHYPVWLAGAALAELLAGARFPLRLAWSAALVFPCALTVNQIMANPILKVVTAALFGCAAVLGFTGLPQSFGASRLGRILEHLGIRSYTLYIVHFPFLALIAAGVIQLTGSRPLSGWLALAGAFSAVGFGWICFQVCERRFLHPRLRPSLSHT
jgi:peptidoglycan/LPS O-acetylase OafA/YrhL